MAVKLYRMSEENGLEIELFDPHLFQQAIDNDGWKFTQEECYEELTEGDEGNATEETDDSESGEVSDDEEDQEPEEDTKTKGSLELMTDDEIRELAKEKKIGNWHNKTIGNLKNELNGE